MASEPDGGGQRASGVVEIWTDGGCKPNPGPGGWGAILRYRGHERELSGAEPALKRPSRVILHTDSEYLRNGITRWMDGWVRRNWRNSVGEPVANMDLWRRLLAAAAPHQIEWRWIRGHAGDPMNERADALATAARDALRR